MGKTTGKHDDFYLLSSHGAILFYIAAHPGCTVHEIADALSVTTRTVWARVGDLGQAGMVRHLRQGRRFTYTVDLDAPFLHPSIQGLTLRTILAGIVGDEVAGSGSKPRAARPASALA